VIEMRWYSNHRDGVSDRLIRCSIASVVNHDRCAPKNRFRSTMRETKFASRSPASNASAVESIT
jgi:hypothetical protein